jgi:hypothetical protein
LPRLRRTTPTVPGQSSETRFPRCLPA